MEDGECRLELGHRGGVKREGRMGGCEEINLAGSCGWLALGTRVERRKALEMSTENVSN